MCSIKGVQKPKYLLKITTFFNLITELYSCNSNYAKGRQLQIGFPKPCGFFFFFFETLKRIEPRPQGGAHYQIQNQYH